MGYSILALSACLLALQPLVVEAQPADRPRHYVFFALERNRIREAAFLETPAIAGAQLKYTWRELEPERDRYDLESLGRDLDFLDVRGKGLFVQIQDVSFDPAIINVPDYLLTAEFGGGVVEKLVVEEGDTAAVRSDGWVARRWDPAVQERFVRLLEALGREFDGRVEGLNLAETAVDFGESGEPLPEGFTFEGYVDAVKAIMAAARRAFPRSHVIQYANFSHADLGAHRDGEWVWGAGGSGRDTCRGPGVGSSLLGVLHG